MPTQDTARSTAERTTLKAEMARQQAEAIDVPINLRLPNSGLYTYSPFAANPAPGNTSILGADSETETAGESPAEAAAPVVPLISPTPILLSEELRLDVDGFYPQMKASGRIAGFHLVPAHWIANVARTAPNIYQGQIWYKEGNSALIPQTTVKIAVTRGIFGPVSAQVTFSGGPTRTRTFAYRSRYFHPVSFEFDVAQGVTATTGYQTDSHPNRPATLPVENLTIVNVFRRMGFNVAVTAGADIIPISEAGANALWSDTEMHDAMQTHWSQFANAPQWALWTFFASLHETGASLGGIMFDDIGPNHRQGTSLFVDSFIKNPPGGDPAPAAWINRMIFWTACHEMGHAFNLAHSWQKHLGTPWIPLAS